MAKATCACCGSVVESRSMTTCPHCLSYLCADCDARGGGVCPGCHDEEE